MERKAFLLSISLSLVSMYLVFEYISGKDAELKKNFGTFVKVVLAERDILQFETLRPTDLAEIEVPMAMKPPGNIENKNDAIDAVAAVPLMKGEHILDNKIISKNIYSGLDIQISQGRRAISVPVNPKSSVGFMLRPGNRVDLAAHFEYRTGSTNISEVKVFMQDVLVLAAGRTIQSQAPKGVDQNIIRNIAKELKKNSLLDFSEIRENLSFAKSDTNFQTVTLEVTPIQAQQITYVMTVFPDAILMLLRHEDDRELPRTATTNLFKVMGEDSYFYRGNRTSPPKSVPRPKFFDFYAGQPVPPN